MFDITHIESSLFGEQKRTRQHPPCQLWPGGFQGDPVVPLQAVARDESLQPGGEAVLRDAPVLRVHLGDDVGSLGKLPFLAFPALAHLVG